MVAVTVRGFPANKAETGAALEYISMIVFRDQRSSVKTYLASHVIASFCELNAAATLSIGTLLPIATSLKPGERLSTLLIRSRFS